MPDLNKLFGGYGTDDVVGADARLFGGYDDDAKFFGGYEYGVDDVSTSGGARKAKKVVKAEKVVKAKKAPKGTKGGAGGIPTIQGIAQSLRGGGSGLKMPPVTTSGGSGLKMPLTKTSGGADFMPKMIKVGGADFMPKMMKMGGGADMMPMKMSGGTDMMQKMMKMGGGADMMPMKMSGGADMMPKMLGKVGGGGMIPLPKAKGISGGGFVDQLGMLAIPLGLIAAKEGVAAMYNRRLKKGSTGKKPKLSATRRRSIFGGGGGEGDGDEGDGGDVVPVDECGPATRAMLDKCGPNVAMSNANAKAPVSNATVTPPNAVPSVGGMFGGAAQAAQHALVAQEFRRMAAEIGSFLGTKGKGRSMPPPKKPAAKKKAAAKKPAAKKKKAAAASHSMFW